MSVTESVEVTRKGFYNHVPAATHLLRLSSTASSPRHFLLRIPVGTVVLLANGILSEGPLKIVTK